MSTPDITNATCQMQKYEDMIVYSIGEQKIWDRVGALHQPQTTGPPSQPSLFAIQTFTKCQCVNILGDLSTNAPLCRTIMEELKNGSVTCARHDGAGGNEGCHTPIEEPLDPNNPADVRAAQTARFQSRWDIRQPLWSSDSYETGSPSALYLHVWTQDASVVARILYWQYDMTESRQPDDDPGFAVRFYRPIPDKEHVVQDSELMSTLLAKSVTLHESEDPLAGHFITQETTGGTTVVNFVPGRVPYA